MRHRFLLLYVLLAAIVGALVFVNIPETHAAPPKPSPLKPGDTGDTGSLQILNSSGQVVGLCPLQHTDVHAEISGFLARVEVTQEFVNDGPDKIEAVYVFPLPQNAAVNDMTMHVGTRVVRGVIKRREDARAIYEQAKVTGHTAALLDQERPNIFTQSVANILPGESVTIHITFVDTLQYHNGSYEFLFPTVVGPRYIPGNMAIGQSGGGRIPDTDRVPDASRITPPVAPAGVRAGHDIAIEVKLDAGVPIQEVRSELHDVDIERTGASSAVVRLKDEDSIPNKDFILRYEVAGAQIADALLTHAEPPKGSQALGGGATSGPTSGYFTFILQPPDRVYDEDVTPRELVFVLDTSGSMEGFPIEKAKETMSLALAQLRPFDTFNLITFSGDDHVLFDQPVPATPRNLAIAQKFLATREGSGGTEMMKAIVSALKPSDKSDHMRIAIFMTDGYVGNDMEIIGEVKKHANARVFAFGIGSSVNRFLLDNMAKEGRGEVEYVSLQSDADAAVKRLEERIHTPLLTDISVDWGGLPVADVTPARPADLFDAKPLVLTGRYTQAASGTITLRGRRAGQPFERKIKVDLPASEPDNQALATLWARRQVDDLMSQDWNGAQQGTMRKDLRAAITQLGLDYKLMTQYTSFVAVEEMVTTDSGAPRTVQVPLEIPQGVNRDMAVGDGGGMVAGGMLAKQAPMAAPPPCNTCSYSTNETVEVVGEGSVQVDTESASFSRSTNGAVDPDAAAKLGAMTDRSAVDVVQQYGTNPSSGRERKPSKKELEQQAQQAKDWKRRQDLQQKYGGKMSAELFAVVACLDGKPEQDAAKCVQPGANTVSVRIALVDNSPATLEKLKALGFRLTLAPTTAKLVYGELPVGALEQLAQMKEVLYVSRAEPLDAKR